MSTIFFKTIWNQRSRNILIFIEFFLIFLVLSNLSIFYTDMISIKRIPNCYQHDNVVKISVLPKGEDAGKNHSAEHLQNLKLSLDLNPSVESVSISTRATPFNYNLGATTFSFGDEKFNIATRNTDIEYGEVMKIKMLKGRWFNETDRGKKVQPAIIGIDVEEETFNGDAIGKRFGEDQYEVIGIVDAFKRSDIEEPYPSMFRLREIKGDTLDYSVDFLIRVSPGHMHDFLNIANREVFTVLNSNHWSISSLNTLENQQAELNADSQIRRLIIMLVVSFVVVNIILGIIGILWYNTNLRIYELGIKRAIGNYGTRIIREIIAENIILAIISSLPVIIILAQSEGLRIAPVKGELFVISQLIAFIIMLLLVILCSWLPARIVSSIHPAVALKYE